MEVVWLIVVDLVLPFVCLVRQRLAFLYIYMVSHLHYNLL